MRFLALELELLNFQSGSHACAANEVHDGFKVDERFALPVRANE